MRRKSVPALRMAKKWYGDRQTLSILRFMRVCNTRGNPGNTQSAHGSTPVRTFEWEGGELALHSPPPLGSAPVSNNNAHSLSDLFMHEH